MPVLLAMSSSVGSKPDPDSISKTAVTYRRPYFRDCPLHERYVSPSSWETTLPVIRVSVTYRRPHSRPYSV